MRTILLVAAVLAVFGCDDYAARPGTVINVDEQPCTVRLTVRKTDGSNTQFYVRCVDAAGLKPGDQWPPVPK